MRATSLLLFAAFVMSAGGCVPHVLHGPRIEEGVSGQLSFTVGQNIEYEEGDDFKMLPSLYGGMRNAWVSSDSTGGAASVGVQVPALLLPAFRSLAAVAATSYLDLYVQPSRNIAPGGIEYGAGLLASMIVVAPYLQVGWLDEEGDGWYTTQMVLVAPHEEDFSFGSGWMPTIAYRDFDPERYNAANLSLTAGMLRNDESVEWILIVGGAIEFGGKPRTP